jgi:hypothetical protein
MFSIIFCDLSLKEGGGQNMDAEITYQSQVTDQFFPVIFSIGLDGVAILKVGTNRDNPLSSVGIFSVKLEERKVSDLVKALRSLDFRSIQNPPVFPEGGSVRLLRFREKGVGEIRKWVSDDEGPPSPVFLKVEKEVLTLIDLVRQHPLQTISMKLTLLPNQIERGKSIEVSISLINPGSEIIQFPHPENWSKDAVQLQLIGLRSDIPLEKLQEYHQKFEDLSKKHIVDIQPIKVKKPLINLSPTNQVIFKCRTSLDWPPGQYDLQVSLITPLLDQKGKQQIRCELISKTIPLKIVGKSKPGDEPKDVE